MHNLLDLERYPLQLAGSAQTRALVEQCREDLQRDGMFTLSGLVRPDAIEAMLPALIAKVNSEAFNHAREHNIYFRNDIDDIPAHHPALALQQTINHTLCGDQLADIVLNKIYEWPPLAAFLAEVMGTPGLYVMDDPLARLNVMTYFEGEGLNWHFDRAEFTTTLLLQAPHSGAIFQYRQGLRSETDPNYDGVAKLLEGADPKVESLQLAAGDLNVFKGKNTAHRVTVTEGERARMIAVFSYYDSPGRVFSAEEQQGFYGRIKQAG
ncbi:MAG: hypothetical protein ACI9LO_000909 [Planctomycetota bacterium]|jgi:hypothetical protein